MLGSPTGKKKKKRQFNISGIPQGGATGVHIAIPRAGTASLYHMSSTCRSAMEYSPWDNKNLTMYRSKINNKLNIIELKPDFQRP